MITPQYNIDGYIFTPATLQYVPAVEQLVNSAYRGEESKQGWTTEAVLLGGERVTAASLLKDIATDDTCIYTCCNEHGEMNACFFLQKKQDKLYIGMLSVSPALQNKGIGKLLLQVAEKLAQVNNCIALTMTVISVRTELIDWYLRCGFKPTGEMYPFDFPGAILLKKEPLHFIVLDKLMNLSC